MNHLTNLYKHKCEQLQEQIYRLTRQLNEFVGGPEPHLPDVPQPFQVPKEFPTNYSAEEDFVNQERDPMNYPPTLKQWLSNYPNPGKTHPNYQYWLMMYQAAQRYYTRAQQAYPGNRSVRESVQYLKRQLNEAEGAVDPTVIQRAPNTTSYVDRSYQDRDSGQWTDVRGNPIPGSPSGPNYKWPLGTGPDRFFNFDLTNPNLTEKDFFPPGLSPVRGPNPRDYAGGEKNEQYQIDRDAWEGAVEAWDEWLDKHGGG